MSGDDQALVEVSGPSGVVPELALQPDGRGVLVWRFATPVRAIATTVLGGGIGEREWAVNAEVGLGYAEADPAAHVASIASAIHRSEEHTSELQSLMRTSYAVFRLTIQTQI